MLSSIELEVPPYSWRNHLDSIDHFFADIELSKPLSGREKSTAVHLQDELDTKLGMFVQDLCRIEMDQVDRLNGRYKLHREAASPSVVEIVSRPLNHTSVQEMITTAMIITYLTLSTYSVLHKDIIRSCRGSLALKVLDVIESVLLTHHKSTHSSSIDPHRQNLYNLRRSLCSCTNTIPQSLFLSGVLLNDPKAVACGSYSEVYDAQHNGSRTALKRLRHFAPASDFLKEALQWSSLHHPSVLELVGIDTETFSPWSSMVSPWMEHGNIREAGQLLASHDQPIPYERWTDQGAHGMEYLHASGLIHGDLRGENVLVDKYFNVKIADFGLSFFHEDGSGSLGSHPGGALRSLAPELFTSEVSVRPTFASDVYAYAFLVIEIWTGRIPFCEYNHWQVIQLVMKGGRPERPTTLLDDAVWELIQECWLANAEDRPVFAEIAARVQSLSSSSPSYIIPSLPLTSEPELSGEQLSDVVVHSPPASLVEASRLENSIHRAVSSSSSSRRSSWYQWAVPSWVRSAVQSSSS